MTVENGNKQGSQENTISPVPDVASSQGAIEPDQIASGAAGTGQENEELEWARRHVPPDPYLAVRKTEIIGWGVRPRHKKGQKRSVKKKKCEQP
jgi:hypothetical protein